MYGSPEVSPQSQCFCNIIAISVPFCKLFMIFFQIFFILLYMQESIDLVPHPNYTVISTGNVSYHKVISIQKGMFFMKKRKWIAGVLILSLSASLTGSRGNAQARPLWLDQAAEQSGQPSETLAGEQQTGGKHSIRRIVAGQNNGLIRYRYLDQDGKEVLPEAGQQAISRKKASALPSSYDSRVQNVVTPIKNQGRTGCCWAFAAIKSLEAGSIQKGLADMAGADYSENHLTWYSYTPIEDFHDPLYGDYYNHNVSDPNVYSLGGNANIAIATLANWWGAAAEEAAPFQGNTQEAVKNMAAGMRNADESLRLRSDVQLKEANCYDAVYNPSHPDEVKKAVMEYGALDVSIYYPSGNDDEYLYPNDEEDPSAYSLYQSEHGPLDANHSVTIVGWDDSFDSFQTPPKGKGAWLIANSYGESSGTDGYFWPSYYDASITELYSFEAQAADTYDTNFQYDGAGWSQAYTDTEDITLANVFMNEEETPQQIQAASFYTYDADQEYEIQIYRNLTDDFPQDGELVADCTTEGTAEYPGYHTVALRSPIAVAPGERFSVLVTFRANGGTSYGVVEGFSLPEEGMHFGSEKKQSYVYFASEDRWYDNTAVTFEESDSSSQTVNMGNVCVKAFASAISQEDFEKQEAAYVPPASSPAKTQLPSAAPGETQLPSAMPGETQLPSALPSESAPPALSPDPAPERSATAPPAVLPTGTPAGLGSPIPAASTGPVPSPGASEVPALAAVTQIKTGSQKLTLGKGETITLSVTTVPRTGKAQLTYSSSKPGIVSVSSKGRLKAKKLGTARIKIQAPSGIQATIKVTVKKAPAFLKASTARTRIKKGQSVKIRTRLNKNSASWHITYHSLKPKRATVTDQGIVKAKRKGKVRIRVSTYNNRKAYVTIRIV